MIHEVTQAANRAAAIVKWLASPAAVIHCNYAANINHGFTPPFTLLGVYYSSTKD